MQNNTAPYRADEVGSLLRTAARQGRARQAREGPDHAAELKKVEDEEIRKVIRKQEEVGLQLATDGEFRRSWWHFDFFWKLTGCERVVLDHGIQFHGVQTKPESLQRHGQARFPRRPPHARALQVPQGQHQGHAEDDHPVAVGDALPRRAQGHQQGGLSRHGRLLRRPRQALRQGASRPSTTPAAATCSSTTRCGPICAPRSRWSRRAKRGEDADKLRRHLRQDHQHGAQVQARRHGDHHARVPRQLPLDLDLGGRLRAGGRGAARPASTTTATSSSTTPSAPAGSSRCASCPRARSGSWSASSPPRAARSRRRTTSSAGSTRPPSTPRSSSCASRPQCGFASTEEGNVLTEDQQWAKLKMIVDISKEVWK